MRVHFGPGYRLDFIRCGRVIVVMLNAGHKSSPPRDIRRALKPAAEIGDDLYKALAPGAKPRFETVIKVARALGVKFTVQPA